MKTVKIKRMKRGDEIFIETSHGRVIPCTVESVGRKWINTALYRISIDTMTTENEYHNCYESRKALEILK